VIIQCALTRTLAILFGAMPALCLANPETGRVIFQAKCQICHATPAAVPGTREEIITTLRTNTVRPHRFVLSGTELNDLSDYLSQTGK
jgi:mono/diheme cytochrome c family protein